jgi:hypothetical protein
MNQQGTLLDVRKGVSVCLFLAALLAFGLLAHAQAGDPWTSPAAGYDLSWWTVDGGAAPFSGGGYSLAGTVGQPDAGLLADRDYTLGGGFWGGGALAVGRRLYLPLVLRRFP